MAHIGELSRFPTNYLEQHTGLEPVLSVWKTDVLTTDTNVACEGLNGFLVSKTPYTKKEK